MLLQKIVMDRMQWNIEAELDDAQRGFRQGKWTGEGLLNLRLTWERHLEVQKKICIHMFLRQQKGTRSSRT